MLLGSQLQKFLNYGRRLRFLYVKSKSSLNFENLNPKPYTISLYNPDTYPIDSMRSAEVPGALPGPHPSDSQNTLRVYLEITRIILGLYRG